MKLIQFRQPKGWLTNRLIRLLNCLVLVVLFFLANTAIAQNKVFKISGIVIDSKGISLPGVNVLIKGTSTSVSTDMDGKYTINVPKQESTLIFSFIGLQTKEEIAKNINGKTVVLLEGLSKLDEVIVIGYGTSTKKDLTGSVGRVGIEDIKKAPVTSFDQALAGRLAGVQVTSNDGQPGAGSQFSIRGSSISQDASPLFVIDGFPTENMDLNSINMNDIESISVLKDASSIAIYGSRAAAGVIIITTKRGVEGVPKFTYNYSLSGQYDLNRINVMSPYEYVKLMIELDQQLSTPIVPSTKYSGIYLDADKGVNLDSYRNVKPLDWADELLQTGVIQNHSLKMTGGNKETRYTFSGAVTDQTGILINTGMKRYDGKMNFDQKIIQSLRIGISAGYTNTTTFGTIPNAGNGGGVMYNMWGYRPVNDLNGSDLAGSPVDDNILDEVINGTSTIVPDNLVNPLQQANNEYRKNITNTSSLNSFLEYTFLKNFKLKVSGGIQSTNIKAEAFYNSKTSQGLVYSYASGAPLNPNGINGQVSNILNSSYLNENTLTYKTTINKKHQIDGLAGFTYQYAKTYGFGFRSINIPQSEEQFGILSLDAGTPILPLRVGSHNQMFSFLSRFNYTYNGKYLFTLTGRTDGTSKVQPGRQWGYFPSGAVAWNFYKESFFKNLRSVVNFGKLKASYGMVGNNKVNDFAYAFTNARATSLGYPMYQSGTNPYLGGIAPFFYGNDQLGWETTKQLDLGLSVNFFDDRISIEADYYDKRTTGALLLATLPATGGYSVGSAGQYQNMGNIMNNGFELTLNTVNISSDNFKWTSNFNISFNKNKILDFYDGSDVRQTTLVLNGLASASNPVAWIAQVGQPIAQFYGYKWGGVYQFEDFDKQANGSYVLKNNIPTYSSNVRPGDAKYVDLNGDGVVNGGDQTIIGRGAPIHFGGFGNNLVYKNFSLNIFFQWNYGNDILNANRVIFEQGPFSGNSQANTRLNQYATFENRWTPDNPTNDIPAARAVAADSGARISDRVIEDGSFLRLKTISLSYGVPTKSITKLGLSSVRFSLSAQNIFTWTKYSGLDPEVSTFRTPNPATSPGGTTGQSGSAGSGYSFVQPSSGAPVLAPGLDYTAYPRAMTVNFGAEINF
jgi:TonB-linked SusC/RagA family outer membrane protein